MCSNLHVWGLWIILVDCGQSRLWPKTVWSMSVWANVGHATKTLTLAKVGLAKVGRDRLSTPLAQIVQCSFNITLSVSRSRVAFQERERECRSSVLRTWHCFSFFFSSFLMKSLTYHHVASRANVANMEPCGCVEVLLPRGRTGFRSQSFASTNRDAWWWQWCLLHLLSFASS